MLLKLVTLLILLLSAPAWGATYYVDNELPTGSNDGSSWANAFRSYTDLDTAMEDGNDTIYFKATSTPYRGNFINAKYSGNTFYFNATGVGTELGSSKAKLFGSTQYSGVSWAQSGSVNTYRTTDINNSYIKTGAPNEEKLGIWIVDSNGTVLKQLTNARTRGVVPTTMVDGEFYAASTSTYVNIGEDPTGKIFEVSTTPWMIEATESGLTIYGGDFRYSGFGHYHAACDPVFIYGSEFSRMQNDGILLNINNEAEESTVSLIHAVSSHHNGKAGIRIAYGAGYKSPLIVSYGLAYNNLAEGIIVEGYPSSSDYSASIYGYTIFENGTVGLSFTDATISGNPTYLTVKNTISHNNTGDEFSVTNTADFNLTASNNCHGGGTYGGKWEANKGSGNIESDPLLNASYGLQGNSPAKDAGAVLYTYAAHPGDYYGRKIYGDGPDIGAVEFEDVSPGSWFFEFFSPPILNLCASTNAACYTQLDEKYLIIVGEYVAIAGEHVDIH